MTETRLCKDCRHAESRMRGGGTLPVEWMCHHPAMASLVDGSAENCASVRRLLSTGPACVKGADMRDRWEARK